MAGGPLQIMNGRKIEPAGQGKLGPRVAGWFFAIAEMEGRRVARLEEEPCNLV